MNTLTVKQVTFGEGIPKICVPVVGKTKEEILEQAKKISLLCAEVAEWRADWYEDILNMDSVKELLVQLRDILSEKLLLFTFRSSKEGGERTIGKETYASLNRIAAQTGCVDLLDVELSAGDNTVKELSSMAKEEGVKVIVSSHDFEKTPEKELLIQKMKKMQELGADICKIAVMPKSSADVITLLSATEEMQRLHAACPLITMSMSGQGVISRLCGEMFGSVMTFGMADKASAPGQIPAERLHETLEFLHELTTS